MLFGDHSGIALYWSRLLQRRPADACVCALALVCVCVGGGGTTTSRAVTKFYRFYYFSQYRWTGAGRAGAGGIRAPGTRVGKRPSEIRLEICFDYFLSVTRFSGGRKKFSLFIESVSNIDY